MQDIEHQLNHPGFVLKEVLLVKKMSQRELAVRTAVTEAYISGLLNGKKALSVGYAKKLEYVLGCDSGVLVEMQAKHDLNIHTLEDIDNITIKEQNIANKLHEIVLFMKQQKFLNESSSHSLLVLDLRRKLKVSNLMLIPDLLKAGIYPPPPSKPANPYILFAWLSICDIITVAMQKGEPFDAEKVKAIIPRLKEVVETTGSYKELQENLTGGGIRFFMLPPFKDLAVRGFVKTTASNSLVLIMPDQRKNNENFYTDFFDHLTATTESNFSGQLIVY